ncbi:MAG TPA: EAL domain-containing protein [Rhodospirillaceae bacterium]|nr:EAL domain-containing protein [Rhodospirillaceae bacterium]
MKSAARQKKFAERFAQAVMARAGGMSNVDCYFTDFPRRPAKKATVAIHDNPFLSVMASLSIKLSLLGCFSCLTMEEAVAINDFFDEVDFAALKGADAEDFQAYILNAANLASFARDLYSNIFHNSKNTSNQLTNNSLPSPPAQSGEAKGQMISDKELAEGDFPFREFFEKNGSVMLIIEPATGEILGANEAAAAYYGYTQDSLVGMSIIQINVLSPDEITTERQRALREERNFFHFRHRLASGDIREVEVYSKPMELGGRRLLFSIVHDIGERNSAAERINRLAYFDQLTGLPNRVLFIDRLKLARTTSLRSGYFGALLVIDLDHFNKINDTLGIKSGDALLKTAAERLIEFVRPGDTLARLGGDEFVLMLENLSASETDAAALVESVGSRLMQKLGQPYQFGDVRYHCTASIGATLFTELNTNADDLLKQSDLALHKAKAAGRNALRFFNPEMEKAVTARMWMEAELHLALNEGQFFLHYQPQVSGEGQIIGAEVLVRWQHPARGIVSPADFIPLSEETGLILPIGHWVLDTVCEQLACWATRPRLADLTVAVNVSVHQFRQRDFVDQVLAVLDRTGANPQRLKLELTETMLAENLTDIVEKMFALKSRGVGFSLDDFGTGYSSLSYLKRLPLDQLKIDQSFVHDILTDANDAAIARTVVALAQGLQLGVIAEGVETKEQRDFLASSGCHEYQGFLYSRPLILEKFEQFATAICTN